MASKVKEVNGQSLLLGGNRIMGLSITVDNSHGGKRNNLVMMWLLLMSFQPTFHPGIMALRLPDFDQFHDGLTVGAGEGVAAETL